MQETDQKAAATDFAVSVRNLVKTFYLRSGLTARRQSEVSAVAGVSFDIPRGTTLGLVGESGCGKSTTARCVLRLIEPTSGEVFLRRQLDNGDAETIDVMAADRSQLRSLRREMQIVFQDPFASLNPRMRVGAIIEEQLAVHTSMEQEARRDRVRSLLQLVGLNPKYTDRFPHEFSGGQRQRIGVARALALNPGFIVADEPVSALDVSIQAQVLNLLKSLQRELGLTYLFIAHNMGVVEHISDRVAVMYLGKVAELAERQDLFRDAQHPYTQALLSAIPIPDPQLRRRRIILRGDVPSPVRPPAGCRFHPRCPLREELGNPKICATEVPALLETKGTSHAVACHFRGEGIEAGSRGVAVAAPGAEVTAAN